MSNLIPFVLVKNNIKEPFEPQKIFDALLRETNMTASHAKIITQKTHRLIISISDKIKYFTAPMIREITNIILLQNGFEAERLKHTRIGMPKYDIDNKTDKEILEHIKKENENVDNLYHILKNNNS